MIVKNEQEHLPRCLASAKPYVDEIVVIDTGSSDKTIEIAENCGAKVEHFVWNFNFADARNYAISCTSGQWILVLDADEELVIKDLEALKKLLSDLDQDAFLIQVLDIHHAKNLTPAWIPRLFRNNHHIIYKGSYHEQLESTDPKNPLRMQFFDGINIIHYGYSPENVQNKNINRNIPMLEAMRQQQGFSLMLLYCLAGMYSNAGESEKATECYQEALDKLSPNLIEGELPEDIAFLPSLLFVLGQRALIDHEQALACLLCQRGLEWFPHYPPLNYLAGATLRMLGFAIGATAYFKVCLQLNQDQNYYEHEPFEKSYMTIYPAYDLGMVYLELGWRREAISTFEQVLTFDPNHELAKQQINRLKNIPEIP
jgi:glycosyltransferase involved in cell wall biosynthesis